MISVLNGKIGIEFYYLRAGRGVICSVMSGLPGDEWLKSWQSGWRQPNKNAPKSNWNIFSPL